ncbi:hypothetical protein Pfo_012706, partial [Paulownia fortunei]
MKNQKWHPQQRKKKQSVETKTMASKTETILKRKPSTNQMCKLNRFFHRNPAELFNFHRHAPLPLPFMFSLLKKNEKLELELELEGFFSMIHFFSIVCVNSYGILCVCVYGGVWGWLYKEFGFLHCL